MQNSWCESTHKQIGPQTGDSCDFYQHKLPINEKFLLYKSIKNNKAVFPQIHFRAMILFIILSILIHTTYDKPWNIFSLCLNSAPVAMHREKNSRQHSLASNGLPINHITVQFGIRMSCH